MKAYEVEHKVLPTVDIIAKALNITEKALKSIYYGKPLKISLDALGTDFHLENEQTELTDTLRDALEMLTERDSKMITLFFIEEYTAEELSAIYGTPVEEVNTTIARILDELKEAHNA